MIDNFSGEIYHKESNLDRAMRTVYANDASEYQEMPSAVALPKTIEDIKKLIHFAGETNQTLIPRAAGTSLAGQVVGNGIVVDISKHFTHILEVNETEQWVRVQPGVIRDDLNAHLKPFGLMFGPETSTSNRAMIGGMIGNNSCGLHSIIWGSTRENLVEIKAILADGSEVIFSDISKDEFNQKCIGNSFENQVYKNLNRILVDPQSQLDINAGFPSREIKRRNTGYALDSLLDMYCRKEDEKINLSKLIAGSEGTLCFITEAKLKLIKLPQEFISMVAVHTESIHDALLANIIALDYGCSASELVDDFILGFAQKDQELGVDHSFISGKPKAILMVEFMEESNEKLLHKSAALIRVLTEKKIGYAYPILKDAQCKNAWDIRKAGLGLLRNLPGDARPVNLIEDCAVAPKDLPAYIRQLEALLQSHGVQYAMYAHAGAGELHVEPILNLKTAKGRELFRMILHDTALLVKSFGGSLSGEHGDGRLRGEFIPLMMGDSVYNLFKQVKKIFDPQEIFNKGKIVDTPPMDSFLRYQVDKVSVPKKTVYDFSQQESFLRLAEKCSGSGDCRKTAVSGGTMCPSYMATRSERDTTRARANILRQYLSNEQNNVVADTEVKEILDLCLSCKACKSECPSSVDVAKMKGEFMQGFYDKHGVPFRTRMIGGFSTQMRLASFAPSLYNSISQSTAFKNLLNIFVGFHPKRTMPLLHNQTLLEWYKKQTAVVNQERTVYLFCDEFTNYNDVHIGKKLFLLLTQLGYKVIVPKHVESGRALLSKGLLRDAQKIAIKNVELLKDIISSDKPLIGIEPSAILGFRDEYIDLVPEEMRPSAIAIANNCFLFEEWFAQEIAKGNISKSSFTKEHKEISLHGHCHQKSMSSMKFSKIALSMPENYHVNLINSGCCGMAGSFGYEKEHYDLSMQIGELVLFPAVRDMSSTSSIVASGTSCRHQIKDGTGVLAKHPIEILCDALV
jgi:FAD/FMN-containing dehydrogenase/Fe-S oxidoreductase